MTGGAGFVSCAVVRRGLSSSSARLFNLDKLAYPSDLSFIEQTMAELGPLARGSYQLLQVDLTDAETTAVAV